MRDSNKPPADKLFSMTIEQYEAIMAAEIGVWHVHLIQGIMLCKETGNYVRYWPDQFEQLVAAGILDQDQVQLDQNGNLIKRLE